MANLKRRLVSRPNSCVDIWEITEDDNHQPLPQYKTSARVVSKPPIKMRITKISV